MKSDTFIVPLWLSDVKGLTHFLLAVAHRESTKSSERVLVEYYDSAPRSIQIDEDKIERKMKEVLVRSGWLARPKSTEPGSVFKDRITLQKNKSDACGIHVILNAWACMLGLDPDDNACSSVKTPRTPHAAQ